MDKPFSITVLFVLLFALSAPTASATTFERPGTWCYQADAGPEAGDLQRFVNCAWNHATGFDTNETPFAFRKLKDILVLGRNDRVRFPVCGFPGSGADSGGDCGWADVDVTYQNTGIVVTGQVPLLANFIALRSDLAIPFTSVPNDIVIKITMPDGRQRTASFSILELRKPETRNDGLAFNHDHVLYGLDEFEPEDDDSNLPPTDPDPEEPDPEDPDPTVHGNPGHSNPLHALHCLISGNDTLN